MGHDDAYQGCFSYLTTNKKKANSVAFDSQANYTDWGPPLVGEF
jgi:hypothetical protein